tara:strand:+ start:3528 stop:4397 length:870 start_codon:yes stop_codon:yes gene_type:complete
MKITSLRNGMVYEKVSKKRERKHFEVLDILSDKIGGYTRELITLGDVVAKSTTSVNISELNNPSSWTYVDGAIVVEQTHIIKKILYQNGNEKIIDRKVNLSDVEKMASVDSLSGTYAADITGPRQKRKKVSTSDQTEADGNRVIYESSFYWNLMRFRYEDIDILGSIISKCVPVFQNIFAEPKNISKQVHLQEFDAWKSDGKSLKEIRDMGNRIKIFSPDQIGTPVSPQTIITRLMKSFYHFGTESDKKSLGLDKDLSDMPCGPINVKLRKKARLKNRRRETGSNNGKR